MDKIALKLLGLQRAEYERAKKDEKTSWVLQIVVTLVGAVSIFIKGDLLIFALALISLFSTFLKWRFTFLSKGRKSISDRARRLVFLIEGLGYKISSKEITDVIATFSVSENEAKKFEDPEYFETKLPVSYKKLCLILQESSFFSKHLFHISAEQTWAFVIATFTLSTATLFVLPSLPSQNWVLAIARVIIIVLMFLTSTDMLSRAISFSRATSVASKTDDRLEQIKEAKHPEHDIIFIFSDYNAGVEGAPLISEAMYNRNKDRLNKLWSERSKGWES